MRDERSRYEKQAAGFLENQFMASTIGVYSLTYSIQGDLFTCEVIPKFHLEERVTLQGTNAAD